MFPDRAKIMGRTVHRKEEIEKAVTSTGTYKLVFNHHPTESDQWIAGASGDAEAVQEVLLRIQDEVESRGYLAGKSER